MDSEDTMLIVKAIAFFGVVWVVVSRLNEILGKVDIIMSKLDELNEELVQANEQSNQIATALGEVGADVDDLIAKLASGGLTAAEADVVKAQIVALKATLAEQAAAAQAIAARHTPDAPPV